MRVAVKGEDCAQDTETHQADDRDFGVAVDLHIPEQGDRPVDRVSILGHFSYNMMGGKSLQEGSDPVSDDVDGGTGVINIGKNVAGLAVTSIRKCLGAPSSPKKGSVYNL